MPFVVLLLILLPFLEIYLLMAVASAIGVVPAIALILGKSLFGAELLRRQGLSALFAAQDALSRGRLPVEAIYDSIGLTVAGALILAPGFITGAFGFALLVPQLRRWVTGQGLRWMQVEHLFARPADKAPPRPESEDPAKPARQRGSAGPVIEGDFHRIED